MNEKDYTGVHTHPSDPTVVEIVAYERIDQSWDVFIFEPEGSVPELESQRVDEEHILVKNLKTVSELAVAVEEIERKLGAEYEKVLFYKEAGTRRVVGLVYDHLRKLGATGMSLRAQGEGNWELFVRRKDVPLAEQVVFSNIEV